MKAGTLSGDGGREDEVVAARAETMSCKMEEISWPNSRIGP